MEPATAAMSNAEIKFVKNPVTESKSAEETEQDGKTQKQSAFEQVPTDFRKWENTKTKMQFEAQLIDYGAGIVHLKKPDGTIIEESLVNYSVGDRKYVREEVEKRKR